VSDLHWTTKLRAATGDDQALSQCIAKPGGSSRRLGAALAIQAERLGRRVPEAWQAELRQSAVNWMLIEEAAHQILPTLAAAGLAVTPIKGYSMTDCYDNRLARPSSDLDLLIAPQDLPKACTVLRSAGWDDLYSGERADRYLAQEGYAWQASRSGLAVLELHHRLWNSVPETLAETTRNSAQPDDTVSAGPSLSLRFILASVHGWLEPRPRRLLDFLDLHYIARDQDRAFDDRVVAVARDHDLGLPVAMAAKSAALVWDREGDHFIAERLSKTMTRIELAVFRASSPEQTSGRRTTLARLLSRRETRLGLRSLLRAVWAHPGIVERETPDSMPWWRRRLSWQLRALSVQEEAR